MPQKDDMLLAWETDCASQSSFVKSESYKVLKSYPSPGAYMVIIKGFNQPILVNAATLQAQKSEIRHPDPRVRNFSYAHCITAHKSQGSEWDNVVVLASDKWSRHDDYFNWLYTSCTRAKKHLTVII
jgi:DNA helicase IV